MGRKNRRRSNRQVSKRRGLFARGVVVGGRRRSVTQHGWELPGAAHAVVDRSYHGKPVNNPAIRPVLIMPDGYCQERRSGKHGYLSRNKAIAKLRELQRVRRIRKDARIEREIYLCKKPGCRYWHLSHDGPGGPKA